MKYHFYDWDESLIISKVALYHAYKKSLKDYNITFNFEYFEDFIYTDATKYLSEICNFSEQEIIVIKNKKTEYYIDDFFNDIDWNWPTIEENSKYIIVTNTNEDLVELLIKKYDKINGTKYSSIFYIVGATTGNEQTLRYKRKPEPDIYEAAFRIYVKKMKPNDELHIYEDSPEGLLAAACFLNLFKKRLTKFYLHHIVV